mmetsp:Transcript_100566/g.300092  ORF Transcript_100566/g.300092 Transcript_100566/m.300092 type:complete len:460 (-) Transcript_100566:39-1418(-)
MPWLMDFHPRHTTPSGVLLLLWCHPLRLVAMSCFSEMNFGWCEFNQIHPEEPPNCPNYTFSIADFQRKLDAHYNRGTAPPPLTEAYFLVRLHSDYKTNLVNQDCPTPLVFAHLLVSELLLISPPWTDETEGWRHYDDAMKLAKAASPFQQHLMIATPPAWPLRKAMAQAQRAQAASSEAFSRLEEGRRLRVDFVVAHCREPLDWLSSKLGSVPPGSGLYVYEKCGQRTRMDELSALGKFAVAVALARPDKGQARGDECSAYLTHIVDRYWQLADLTVFLQSDPHDHLHFDFVDLVLRSIAAGTYSVPYLPLNGPRHLRTLTPCLQAVHEEIFGSNLTGLVGPYCCAQFVVSRDAIQRRGRRFYSRMLGLVDGSRSVDLCGIAGTKRSTQCYGYEFLWHVVFGEELDPPNREEDPRLPVALRLTHGREHTRLSWAGMPLARDIPLKIVPDYEHGNPLEER